MSKPGEKNISAFIDPKIAEQFDNQTSERRQLKRAAIEGAVRQWLKLTVVEQSMIMAGEFTPSSDPNDLDSEIRELAVRFARLTKRLEGRASSRKKGRHHKESS